MELQPVMPYLEKMCRATVEIAELLDVGKTPLAERRIFPIIGGHFEGEKLSGEVLPGGADWQLVLSNGTVLLDARYTLRTPDGALIYIQNRGVRCGPPEVLAQLRRGEMVDPADYYFRTTPTFETGAAHYAWLNEIIAVCSGLRLANKVILDFYVVK